MYCIRHIQNSELCLFRYMQAYSSKFSIIKSYSCILRYFWGIFSFIQAYLRPCVAIAYSEPYNLEADAYSKPFGSLTRHIQNPATVRTVYLSIIKPYSSIFKTLLNACIFRNLAYSESWNNQISSITASRCRLRTLSYLWR